MTLCSSSLSGGWASQDFLPINLPTGASISGGTFTVSGAGCCLSGDSDSARFLYQPLTGDGAIIARIASLTNFNGTAEGRGDDPRHAGSRLDERIHRAGERYGDRLQDRQATFGPYSSSAGGGASAPYWVKLVRSGSSLTGYFSSDGLTWTVQDGRTVPMGTTVYVGLVVTSESGVVTTATFDNVTITMP